jgi:hypothetical protein
LAPETASEARDGVNTKAAPAPAKTGDTKKEVKSAKLSFGLDDVVKMVQSGVAPDVILTYIDNSTVAYYATAEDVVQLHEAGVPSQITAALIRHGGKLRAQQAQVAREIQTAVAPPATPNYSSAYSYAEQPAQPTYVTYNYCCVR